MRETGRLIPPPGRSCHVRTDFKARCKFLAWVGDISYRGHGYVSYSRELDKNLRFFNTNFKVRFTNHYCLAVQDKPRGKCIKKKHW